MLLSVDRLSISFNTFYGKVHVLDQVSFSVDKGEILAIVGESGSGKSVSAYSILGLLDKNASFDNGRILFNEIDLTKLSKKEIRQYRGKKIGMVFQEPMTALNPTMRVEDQLLNVLKRHRNLSRREAYTVMLDMLRDVHFDDPQLIAKKYPYELSGGMRQRIVIALAMAGHPELLIADEPTTALDVTIQGEVLSLIRELTKKNCTTVLLITHDLGVVKEVSDRVCVMYGGKIMEHGKTSEIFNSPSHPYTKALLQALPDRVDKGTRLQEIQGEIPSLISRPTGCIFSSRCPISKERCFKDIPSEKVLSNEHAVNCWEVD